jgi:hypothetical protein
MSTAAKRDIRRIACLLDDDPDTFRALLRPALHSPDEAALAGIHKHNKSANERHTHVFLVGVLIFHSLSALPVSGRVNGP